MATDFGDESGEKLFDWMLKIGQDAGEQAMLASAERLKSAFRNARGEISGTGDALDKQEVAEWAKLSMEQFEKLPEYESIKELIDDKLSSQKIEHSFYSDEGRDFLLFRVEDAPDVSRSFEDLEEQTDATCDKALAARGKTREQIRDARPLEERAADAREGAKALEAVRGKSNDIELAAVKAK